MIFSIFTFQWVKLTPWFEDFLRDFEVLIESFNSIEHDQLMVYIGQSFFATFFVVMVAMSLVRFPGHPRGKYWPIYIPEQYGERNSQHLLDPYRYTNYFIFPFFLSDFSEILCRLESAKSRDCIFLTATFFKDGWGFRL